MLLFTRHFLNALKLLLIALFIVIITFSFLAAWHITHPKRISAISNPEDLHLHPDKVTFPSTDGLNLQGWFFRHPQSSQHKVIILCHGYGSEQSNLLPLTFLLYNRGFDVFSFDWRAHGRSEGSICTLGNLEQNDLNGAISFIRSLPEFQTTYIGVLGFSMGAAAAILTAAHNHEINAIACDSSFSSIDHLLKQSFSIYFGLPRFPFYYPVRLFIQLLTGMRTLNLSPESVISKLSPRPILLIHGTSDANISPDNSQILYNAAKNPKEIFLVPGATHLNSMFVADKEYNRHLLHFFNHYLSHPNTAKL